MIISSADQAKLRKVSDAVARMPFRPTLARYAAQMIGRPSATAWVPPNPVAHTTHSTVPTMKVIGRTSGRNRMMLSRTPVHPKPRVNIA